MFSSSIGCAILHIFYIMLSLFHAVRAEKVIAINVVKVRGQVKRNRLLKVGSKSQNILFQFSFLLYYIVIPINFIFKTF